MIKNITLENLGTVNKNVVTIDMGDKNILLYFSYKTLVGIEIGVWERYCRQNDWSTTTGKLLNQIEPDKTKRLTEGEFNIKVAEVLKLINK